MPSRPKEAHRTYQQRHYDKNREYYKQKRRKRQIELAARLKKFKESQCCSRCGEGYTACLDFHHTDPCEKESEIYRMVNSGISWKRIAAELAKCVCICANCHRKTHDDPIILEEVNKLPRCLGA